MCEAEAEYLNIYEAHVWIGRYTGISALATHP